MDNRQRAQYHIDSAKEHLSNAYHMNRIHERELAHAVGQLILALEFLNKETSPQEEPDGIERTP